MAIDPGVVGLFDLCNAAVSVVFLRVGLRHRDRPGANGFIVMVFGITVWSVAIGVDKFFWGLGPSIAAFNFVFFGGQLTAVGWFLMTVEFTGLRSITRRLVAPFGLAILAGQLLFWTNPLHQLVVRTGTRVESASLDPVYGPGFFLAIGSFYALTFVGTGLLVRDGLRSSGVRRTQDVVLAAAVVPPIVATVITVFDLAAAPYDITPFGFLIAEVLFAWVLFRLQLFGVLSAGRRVAIEELPDAVITLDATDAIVDSNAAATELFGVDADDIGRPAVEALKWHPTIARHFERDAVDGSEVRIDVDGEPRRLRLSTSSFEAPAGGDGAGRIVVIRDVTARKRRERQLRVRQRELDRLRRVLTGLLQEDLRSSLRVLERDARTLRDRFDDARTSMAEAVLDQVEELQELRRKVMAINWLSERRTIATHDLAEVLEETVGEYRERFPAATIELETRDRPSVRASDGLGLAIENLIENAIVHGGEAPTVAVTLVDTDEGARLTIADDGPGIPRSEVRVLDRGAETQLRHGTGIGLWLVKLVVDHSGATLQFDADDDGTIVTIGFPPPEPAGTQEPGAAPTPSVLGDEEFRESSRAGEGGGPAPTD